MSLSGALLLSNVLFFALSAAAVAASVAVFFIARAYDRDKDRELSRYQAFAAADVARAKSDAAAALADAARANERAAELEKEAVDARVEQAKLKESNLLLQTQLESQRLLQSDLKQKVTAISPRRLDGVQRATLHTNIIGFMDAGLAVEIGHDGSCADCELYASDIALAFEHLDGVTIRRPMFLGVNSESEKGLLLRARNEKMLKEFKNAFETAGIPCDFALLPLSAASQGMPDVEILVTLKSR